VIELAENLPPDDFPDLTRMVKHLKNRLESRREEQMRQMEISSEADTLGSDMRLEKLKRYCIPIDWDESTSTIRVKLTDAVTPADHAEILKGLDGDLKKIEITNIKYEEQWMIERRSRESKRKDHDSFEFNLILQQQSSVEEPGGCYGPEHISCPKQKRSGLNMSR